MNNNNLVSIIIATYNRAGLIKETLDSVRDQTYTDWECIVVDDGSSDDTEQVVSEYMAIDSRIKFFNRPLHIPKGPNGARNYGIDKSSGKYIMSLDSDDWLLPNHIAVKIKVFDENPTADGVLSKTIMTNDAKEEIKREHRTKLSDNLIEDFITLKISWYMHDIMWRKEFLEGKMLYNEKLLKWLDRDFHIRRLAEKPKLVLADTYLTLYRIHSDSNSSNAKYTVLETRHRAVLDILDLLQGKKMLNSTIKLFFFKFQVQNLIVLYESPDFFKLYWLLIKKTFIFNLKYLIWISKLIIGYCSFKLTGRGLKIIR
ncbi:MULTISPECIES: glycosyltransferase family 2 protein [Flavobacterium]|uniref:Glycosyltransferase family 2 protein n=1 Tax=Flavobacterium hankyongi TaxID=1176532 RepID=A0ABP9A1H7_9FLAO|nr:glycosyltransferase family A protein [Flavobacterium sp. N1846]